MLNNLFFKKTKPYADELSFSVDKKYLSIDFEALNLIQLALFAIPNREIVIRLKKLFGIPFLTHLEVLQELQNIHSPLRKYLQALMMSVVIRCHLLLQENFQNTMTKLMKRRAKKLMARLMKLRQRKTIKFRAFKKKLKLLNYIAMEVLQKVPDEVFPYVKNFALEGHRYDLLYFYLGYADAKLAPVIVDMVNSHINMLIHGYNAYENIAKRPNLTMPQRVRLHEWLERRMRRLESLNPENIKKILPHLPLVDPVSLKQHLTNIITGDMIEFHKIRQIESQVDIEEESVVVTPCLESNKIFQDKTQDLCNKKQILEYRLFQSRLNDLFVMIFDRHEGVLIYEALTILSFLDMLTKIVQKKYYPPSFLAEVKLVALELVVTLSQVKDVDYSELTACIIHMYREEPEFIQFNKMSNNNETHADVSKSLPHTSQNGEEELARELNTTTNSDSSHFDIISRLVASVSLECESKDLTSDYRLKLTELLTLLKSTTSLSQESVDQIINHYNQIKFTFTDFDISKKIFETLSKLPGLNIDRLCKTHQEDLTFSF